MAIEKRFNRWCYKNPVKGFISKMAMIGGAVYLAGCGAWLGNYIYFIIH